MTIKYLYKTQIINILIAILIGLFVVFPDVLRMLDSESPDNLSKKEQFAAPMHNRDDFAPNDMFEDNFPPPMSGKMMQRNQFTNERKLTLMLFDFLHFVILSYLLLLINTPNKDKNKTIYPKLKTALTIATTFAICCLGVYLNSLFHPNMFSRHSPFPWYLDGILLFKGIFIFVSVVLFGQLFNLLYKQQNISIENEKLKAESLQNRFDALSAQISPHFFFNSLNSLSGLVRENQNQKALKYINEISKLFRYILNGNWQELAILEEEIQFLDAYRYLLTIKYEDRLTFEIDIDQAAQKRFKLPTLSIQPLVENITKHNTISDEYPIKIKVYIRENNTLIIENQYQPKPASSNNTGIGLNNLSKRYRLLTGNDIRFYVEDELFTVELPLNKID